VCSYATHSLKILDDSALRLPEEVEAARRIKTLQFKFPSAEDSSTALRSVTDESTPVLTLSDASLGYGGRAILSHVTLQVRYGVMWCVGMCINKYCGRHTRCRPRRCR
jgi:hypothetical protein